MYVANTPKATPDDIVRVALRIQALGLTASPHIIARRVVDPQRLRERLHVLVAGGVEQVLLVAGDLATPNGPFTSTLELLDSGVVHGVGIKRVGSPVIRRVIPQWATRSSGRHSSASRPYGRASGFKMHIATQFGFDSRSLVPFEQGLRSMGSRCPSMPGSQGQHRSPNYSSTPPIAGWGHPSRRWPEMPYLSGAYLIW